MDSLKLSEIGVDLDLSSWHTVVSGESAAGKTLLISRIQDYLALAKVGNKDQQALYNSILVVNYLTRNPLSVIKDSSAKVVFIDNADPLFIQYPELLDYVNSDLDRSYVLMLRNYSELNESVYGLAELAYNDGSFSLYFPYRK
jgi:hypothetical protein